MHKGHSSYFDIHLILCVGLVLSGLLISCTAETGETDPESDVYRQAVSDFYLSLGASQTDEALFAYNKMNDVAAQYPDEPAAWANLGVFAMRQGNFELAREQFTKARELEPDNADILFLSGLLESRMGNIERAIQYLEQGAELDPENLRIRYSLASELEREDDTGNADQIIAQLQSMHETDPDNLVILYELIRVTAKQENRELVETYVQELSEFSGQWPSRIREQFDGVRELINEGSYDQLSVELAFLRNGLDELPSFREHLNQVRLAPNEIGFLIPRFLRLPQPEMEAAEPDSGMSFNHESLPGVPPEAFYLKSVTLLEDLPPISIYGSGRQIHIDEEVALDFPGSFTSETLPARSVEEVDYNDDFRNDLAMAGREGFKLYRQNEDFTFTEVTGDLSLPFSIIGRSYNGVWTADLDTDGDLDLILSPTRMDQGPVTLRNNGDGTFSPIDLFGEIGGIVEFMWADLDAEGTPDAVFLDQNGNLHVYMNQRSDGWVKREDLPVMTGLSAFTITDLNADSYFNLVVLTNDFNILRLDYEPSSGGWTSQSVVRSEASGELLEPATSRLFSHDFDNNGRLDLMVSSETGSRIWLGDNRDRYIRLEQPLPGKVYSVFDLNGNERLDLLGISADEGPFRLINTGTKDYGARSIRARASGTEGDRRINSFGIGGQMEVRSGLLYQKQLISSPIVHFGLGNYEEAEMLRIIWPNGSVQAEFAELGMGSTIFNEQILKGSCPWLFAHDGKEMQFVTDILWRSPLGLRINARQTAGVAQTLDRVKIPGRKIRATNGVYDLRVTAELWETHFFDSVSLVAVDHPVGTEIFIDERFDVPSPDLSSRAMTRPRPFARVWDDQGRDVTATVREVDQNYLKAFEKTKYQGLVEEHFIEVDLGDEPPVDEPMWLVASGWLRPTDSSINLALSQGEIRSPEGLRIEVSDGEGGWIELHSDYGIPAGKLKTILVDLEGVFPDSNDRRIRMHTTSEIYWDALQWARGVSGDQIVEQELPAETMELRYRGYSEWYREDEVSPKLADYNTISGTTPRWRDLIGYHTRFGDVSELLENMDDRYVIMNAGDELVLRFSEIEGPQEGQIRSYVFVSDGWEKDGDYNTEASKTVLPLPYHGQKEYEYSSNQTLYDDPVYQKYKEDWRRFHTRLITPYSFQYALKFND
ncbi:MAG: FG-GAP-like repeat-containing protein [Balneolaceae bacterium]